MNEIYSTPKSSESIARNEGLEAIVRYWERKRVVYNLLLLSIGLACLIFSKSIFIVPIPVLLISVIFYGVGANIFYTLGGYVNIIAVIYIGAAPRAWRSLFYVGLVFSMLLTGFLGFVALYILTPF